MLLTCTTERGFYNLGYLQYITNIDILYGTVKNFYSWFSEKSGTRVQFTFVGKKGKSSDIQIAEKDYFVTGGLMQEQIISAMAVLFEHEVGNFSGDLGVLEPAVSTFKCISIERPVISSIITSATCG
jgi:hypothetical protein